MVGNTFFSHPEPPKMVPTILGGSGHEIKGVADHFGGFRAWIPERSDFFQGPKGPEGPSGPERSDFFKGPKDPKGPLGPERSNFFKGTKGPKGPLGIFHIFTQGLLPPNG